MPAANSVIRVSLLGFFFFLSPLLAQTPDPQLGKRIYREGLLSNGEPIRSTVAGDVPLAGIHCASCHRLSGYGSAEGMAFAPPVTAPFLFQVSALKRGDLFRRLFQDVQPAWYRSKVYALEDRPAYTPKTLAMAIRNGQNASGRRLDPAMPRYQLDDEEMAHLISYLQTLAALPAPGIDAEKINFATVVTEGVPAGKREAMLDVINAYVKRKNRDTRGVRARPAFSPLYKADFMEAYRLWEFHVWELKGKPETWQNQLRTYYRAQPVFAMVSGIGIGDWRPIHNFCEGLELPCLFPCTDQPVTTEPGGYSLYFSKGLSGEAEALVRHIQDEGAANHTGRYLQVYRETSAGTVPAATLRRLLHADPRFSEEALTVGQKLTPTFWRRLLQREKPSALVLWLEDEDLETLNTIGSDGISVIYLSYSLLKRPTTVLETQFHDKIRLTYPFTLPDRPLARGFRVNSWLRSRSVSRRHSRIQFNTFFALTTVDHGLVHLVENFSREYLIESIEHETENGLNPGVFPHLSLGPGQRFASKGAYIVRLSPEAREGLEAVSDWIVP